MGNFDKFDSPFAGLSASYGKCRHRPTLIFKAGDVEFYGASEMYVTRESVTGFDLVINLLGRRRFREQSANLLQVPRKWTFLRRFMGPPTIEEVVIDWPDFGIVPLTREFWMALYEGIRKENCKKVLIFCMGGHGRTGTAAGCLMTVALEMHGGAAIRDVRSKYCPHAIETKGQEDYVRSMTRNKNNG